MPEIPSEVSFRPMGYRIPAAGCYLGVFLYVISMDFDFFISHSSKDKHVADEICAALERSGIRCWIAPRDIGPGDEYGAAIVHAIDRCRAMVLVFSSNSNASRQVSRELERGVSRDVPILPVRIEDVAPRDALAYFVASVHWFDAVKPPLEDHLQRLADSANRLLRGETPPDNPQQDPSLRRLSTPVATRTDRVRLPIWPTVGKYTAGALIMCAGTLSVIFAATRWHGSDVGVPVASVAERVVDVPAQTAVETSARTQPSQGASQNVKAVAAETKVRVADEPVVDEARTTEASRPIGNVATETVQSEVPRDVSVASAVNKDVPSTEPVPATPGTPPSPALFLGNKDNPYFTAADARRVEELAAKKKFSLPKYQIAEIDPEVPRKFRRYVGIWVTKIGFNGGLGAEGMLIVSDVDVQGTVGGTYILGPPKPTSYEQRPASSWPISGAVENDVLSIVLGSNRGTINFASSNNLLVKWVRKTGQTATATFYPVWLLSEREGAPSMAKVRKPD